MASFELFTVHSQSLLEDGVSESNYSSRKGLHRQFVEDEMSGINDGVHYTYN